MIAKRYGSDAELLDDMFSRTVNKNAAPTNVEPSWTDDYVRRADEAEQGIVRTAQVEAAAELIAQLFEDPELSPNLVVWQQADDPLPPKEWRKAAKRAGVLLGRYVEVFKSRGRQTAVLHQNEDEKAAEEQRLGEVMDAVHSGNEPPPPLPRKYR